jgi:hypothetical protein
LAAVLLVALRLVAEADFVAAEVLALPRLDADEAFFLETRLFPLRGFSLPVTVSTNTVTALDAISFVAAMFILAASAIAPSKSTSIGKIVIKQCRVRVALLGTWPPSDIWPEYPRRVSEYSAA